MVENLNRNFVTLEDIEAYVENIDENGNIEVEITENNDYILQSFTVKASRKRLNRLKEVAAYNVGQCLDCENGVESLQLPKTLKILVKKFVNTYMKIEIYCKKHSCRKIVFLHPYSTSRKQFYYVCAEVSLISLCMQNCRIMLYIAFL